MSFIDILKTQLIRDEGVRKTPYRCSAGKTTIGVGHNLDDNGLPESIINDLLDIDMEAAIKDASTIFINFDSLSDRRKAVVCNMAFNLGKTRLMQFKKMIKAVGENEYNEAADQMMDSRWSNQVGIRAERLATIMRLG